MAKFEKFQDSSQKEIKSNLLKIIWEFFLSFDKFTAGFIIFVLIFVISTPFIVNNIQRFDSRAAKPSPTGEPTEMPFTPTPDVPTPVIEAPTETPALTQTPTPTVTLVLTSTPTLSPTDGPTETPVTPTATSTPVPLTPTSSPIPTNTPTPVIVKEDINKDGCVGILDFNIWLNAFKTQGVSVNTFPDINMDGKINLLDYNLWFITMIAPDQGIVICQ